MSGTATAKAATAKFKKDRERNKDKQPQVSERLKTVVRRLPPNLPEDIFWGSVATWVTDDTVTWKAYYGGKSRKRLNKENIPSRAYIAFKNEEILSQFGREYDGHLFRDKQGNEYQAVVEFAPYQKIPSEKKKVDARNATIEKDEDYISFIESLKAAANAEPVSIESLIAASQPTPPPKTTPLLEALKAEKTAHKDKEAILRNHAHYKDPAILAPPRKEELKKKGAPPAKPAEPGPGTSKKAAKKQAAAASQAASSSAQKPPPAPATPAKTPAPANVTPKAPKQPRPPKPAAQTKQPPGGAKPAPPAPVIATSAALPVALAAPGAASSAQAGASSPAAAPPARRTRPVIGLASRQFEAALNGVGVGAPGGADRKSRREREREREQHQKEAGTGGGAAGTAGPPAPAAPAPTVVKPTPPSPRRARHQKETGGAGAAAAAPSAPPQVPGILQPPLAPALHRPRTVLNNSRMARCQLRAAEAHEEAGVDAAEAAAVLIRGRLSVGDDAYADSRSGFSTMHSAPRRVWYASGSAKPQPLLETQIVDH
ncbi:putative smg-4/UPF3 family protein [Lyophyllum shimeji]|uniref:Smg-4/UPF3 family protein n=1 Tax=Lyophyllum shimeji TaxID=47721 RepID=A0A9P3PPR8_LYOSH|nr:putative smg-4/UPF3 family protein [Lyophyllum shimeji]